MPPDVEYASVEIPPDKPAEEYHYTERRAELLDLIHRRGSPHALNQTRLADRYGVSQQQISQDFDRLAAYVDDTLGTRRSLHGRALYERCIRGLLDDEDWRGAAQVQTMYEKWLDRRCGVESPGEDLTAFDGSESDSYRIVDADDEPITTDDGDGGDDDHAEPAVDATDARDGALDVTETGATDATDATDADPAPDGGRSAADPDDPDAEPDVLRGENGEIIARRVTRTVDPADTDTDSEPDEYEYGIYCEDGIEPLRADGWRDARVRGGSDSR